MDKPASLPIGADMGAWAANEVQKHEEICGLRYEAIRKEMELISQAQREGIESSRTALLEASSVQAARTKAIEDKIGGATKWVMGILASLSVALVVMYLNNAQATKSADEADKREMRARLSLLTTQLQNVQPRGTVVVAPPGTQAITPAAPEPAPLDQEDLSDASGGKPK